jgi:hypothetical protein
VESLPWPKRQLPFVSSWAVPSAEWVIPDIGGQLKMREKIDWNYMDRKYSLFFFFFEIIKNKN